MTYKTKKLDTLTSYSGKLASDLLKACDDVEGVSLNSSAQGSTAIVEYNGMLYRLELVPTYMALVKEPTLEYVFLNEVSGCDYSECESCTYCEETPDAFDTGDSPSSYECVCYDHDECDAAKRIHEEMLEIYREEAEE